MSKVIAVIGATGAQGGSVVQALLKKKNLWTIRALTRDDQSAGAKELKKQGVEVVKCDPNVQGDLERAFAGAYGVFGVTTFDMANGEKELEQGKAIVNAAKSQKVSHLVLSTLANSEKLSGGKRLVHHFTRKALIEDYARQNKDSFALTFVQPSCYYENFQTFFVPRPDKDGNLSITINASPDAKVATYAVADTGDAVAAVFEDKDKYNGKTLPLVGDYITFSEVAAKISKATGKSVTYNAVPESVFATFFPGAAEYADMFGWFNEYGYYGEKNDQQKQKDMWKGKEVFPGMRTMDQWLADIKYKL